MKRILYVLHSDTNGGTFFTNNDLMKNVVEYYDTYLLAANNQYLKLFRYSDGDLNLIKKFTRKNQWSAKNFHDSWLNYIYFKILTSYSIDIVHIRHFINHSFDLPEISKKLDIPVVVSLHDFYLACPYYVLLDENNNYCGGKCKENSRNCYNSLASLNDINSKDMIDEWRNEVTHMMKFVDYLITTADFVKNLFISIYPYMEDMDFDVIEHGRDFPKLESQYFKIPSEDNPIKILCPANYLNIMKGSEFIKNLKNVDVENKLEFHFLGNCRDGIEEYGVNHGPFKRDDFYKEVNKIKPSFIGIFSIWPETFCHTLTESWSCGIPVLGSNIGVVQDRILQSDGGWILDINNPHESYKKILSLAKDTEEYLSVVDNIRQFSLKTTKQMADEYIDVYNSLVGIDCSENIYIACNDYNKNMEIISQSNLFDEDFYLNAYPDVKKTNMDPLEHWVRWGYDEAFRNPNNNFSNEFYSKHYLDNEPNNWNALTHYIVKGKKYGNKRSIFDPIFLNYGNEVIENILNALSKKISIVIPVFKYDDELIIFIRNLVKNTLNSFELIILSNDDLKLNVDKKVNYKLFKNSTKMEFIDFINVNVKHLKNDFVILDYYSQVSHNWLTNLIIKAYSNKDIGFVSPLSNFFININLDNDSILPTNEGISVITKKSSINEELNKVYGDGCCLFVKSAVLDTFSFDKSKFRFDSLSQKFCIDLDSDWMHIFDDSCYVYHDMNFFKTNNKFLKSISSFNYDDVLDTVEVRINEAMHESNYKSLSHRLLFITQDIYDDYLVINELKKSYDCYFFVKDEDYLILRDSISIINSWDLNDYSANDSLKNIYFNILASLKIDIIQINKLILDSYDIVDVAELFNIPILLKCKDDCYISSSDENISLFEYSNVIFKNDDLKNRYLSHFSDLTIDCQVIDDNDLEMYDFLIGGIENSLVKCVIFGDLSDNGENTLPEFLEFHSFGEMSLSSGNIINHGEFSEDKLIRLVDELHIDFFIILDNFSELFTILDISLSNKIPILLKNNNYFSKLVDEIPGSRLMDVHSFNSLVDSMLSHCTTEIYAKLIKEMLVYDNEFNTKLTFVLKDYFDVYTGYEKNSKIVHPESILKNNHENKEIVFSDLQGFLANSYVSPIINAPFSEEEKRCFAIMDNIAKYLSLNVRNSDYNPLVSIIMPVYNRVDVITTAIDSVLNQTYRNIELIIVDDGSVDGTRQLLNNIENNKVNVIFHEKNKGSSGARNTGLIHSHGEIIMYLDSDNEWCPNYVESMVGAFLELPNADAVYSGQLLYKNSDNPFAIRFGAFNKALLRNRNYIDMNCFCHKRYVFEKIGGFDEKLNRLVDWDFILKINNSFKIYSIPVLLSKYYLDVDNRITTNSSGNIGIHFSNVNYVNYLLEKNKSVDCLDKKLSHKVTIIIPSYESLFDLKECINTILSFNYDNVNVIIVDNNSGDVVRSYLNYLKEFDEIFVIQNDVNYGFTYAVNQAIEISDEDSDILLLNNDAFLTNNALKIMQDSAYSLKNSGIIVPQQVLPKETPTMNVHVPYANSDFDCDVNPSKHHKNIINMPLFHDGNVLELNFAPFFCAYIKRDVLNNSLGLDAELGRHYRSDRIFSDYIRNVLKLNIYHISKAIVYHKLQVSTKKLKSNDDEFDLMFSKNRWDDYLAKKLYFKRALWDF